MRNSIKRPYLEIFQQYRQSFNLGWGSKKLLEMANNVCLATVDRHGNPHATMVWFVIDGNNILIGSKKSTYKVRNIQSNTNVYFTSGRINVFGTAKIKTASYDLEYCKNLIRSRYKNDYPKEMERIERFLDVIDCVIVISIEKVGQS